MLMYEGDGTRIEASDLSGDLQLQEFWIARVQRGKGEGWRSDGRLGQDGRTCISGGIGVQLQPGIFHGHRRAVKALGRGDRN